MTQQLFPSGCSLDIVLNLAKSQFEHWCSAFRQLVTASGDLVIRFCIADPFAFCLHLQRQLHGIPAPPFSSRPWSGTLLKLDNSIPSAFNIIDTTTLIDSVGVIDILIATTPLLQRSPSSNISMDTVNRPWSQETELLTRTFCEQLPHLFILLGIVPLAFLTNTTTRGLLQDLPTVLDFFPDIPSPVHHRLTWKIPASGDPAVPLNDFKFSYDTEELTYFISRLLLKMLDNTPQPRGGGSQSAFQPNNYTVDSVAALLSHLVRNSVNMDWDKVGKSLTSFVIGQPKLRLLYPSIRTSQHMFGLDAIKGIEIDGAQPINKRCYFGKKKLPQLVCIVLTVPRQRLRPIVDKIADLNCIFDLQIHDNSGDQNSRYLQSFSFDPCLRHAPRRRHCGRNRCRSRWLVWVFRPSYLRIRGAVLLEPTIHPYLLEDGVICWGLARLQARLWQKSRSLRNWSERWSRALPPIRPWLGTFPFQLLQDQQTDDGSKLITTYTFSSTHALGLKVPLPDQVVKLLPKAKINLKQTSPCVITVNIDKESVAYTFPFPINGKDAKILVARTSGWVKVVASPTLPNNGTGGYLATPWPVIRNSQTTFLCNWNLPAINFRRLHRLDGRITHNWFMQHLRLMSSGADLSGSSDYSRQPLRGFKIRLDDLFRCISMMWGGGFMNTPVRFSIQIGDIIYGFFVTPGFYMDASSHNLVASLYICQAKPGTKAARLMKSVDFPPQLDPPAMKEFWRMVIPSMVERCRDWEHKDTCEYKTVSTTTPLNFLCSCGNGKVCSKFLEVDEWAPLAPYVTRAALSPAFPPPFIEQTRTAMLQSFQKMAVPDTESDMESDMESDQESDQEETTVRKGRICAACKKGTADKKCARCEKTYYCGKECQKRDWKNHKNVCLELRSARYWFMLARRRYRLLNRNATASAAGVIIFMNTSKRID